MIWTLDPRCNCEYAVITLIEYYLCNNLVPMIYREVLDSADSSPVWDTTPVAWSACVVPGEQQTCTHCLTDVSSSSPANSTWINRVRALTSLCQQLGEFSSTGTLKYYRILINWCINLKLTADKLDKDQSSACIVRLLPTIRWVFFHSITLRLKGC